jgi:transcriptional regulator GlxA family with amidase domain
MEHERTLPRNTSAPIDVAMVAYPDAHILDIVGPLEVLSGVALFAPESAARYRSTLLAADEEAIATTSGLTLQPDLSFAQARRQDLAIDTLIVAGGHGTSDALRDEELLSFVSWASGKARRVVSICTGAMILAELGLLDDRRATTHWWWAPILAKRYPKVRLEPDSIYVRDGHVWTSAGVTSGMDLALALVEEDFGHDVALQVARYNVMYMMRPGGQAQFSASLIAQQSDDPVISRVLAHVRDNPGGDLGVEALSALACMSERSFARRFKECVGMTPASYVEVSRLQAARVALEQSDALIDRVALDCGFGNAERMRRVFQRHLGISAGEYRDRFRAPVPAPVAGPVSGRIDTS